VTRSLEELEVGIRAALNGERDEKDQSELSVTGPPGETVADQAAAFIAKHWPRMRPYSRRWWELLLTLLHVDATCVCGQPLPKRVKGGRAVQGRRDYCSNACRQRAYRKRKAKDAA
jgi:hypothetical protein